MGRHKISWSTNDPNRLSRSPTSPISPRRLSTIELYPPFLGKELQDVQDEEEEEIESFSDEIDDPVTVCNLDVHRELFSIQEEPVSPCKDDCRRRRLTCEEFREVFEEQIAFSASGAEADIDELFYTLKAEEAAGYLRYEDEFMGEEEEDDERRRKKLFPWMTSCESIETLSDDEEFPNTTDPYICHELYLPYAKTPRSRQFKDFGEGIKYSTVGLPRRPRSPIRDKLPDQFRMDDPFEERSARLEVIDTRRILEESKQRISMSMMQLPHDKSDRNMFISSVVLQAVCEQVTLTLIDARINTNIHTFVNAAVLWALSEMQLLDDDLLCDEQLQLPDDIIYCQHIRRRIADMKEDGGMRKLLLGAYKPPISRNIYTTLHRRLPWSYVCPSHEQGHVKFYPNIRERIEEKDSDTDIGGPMSTYIPDVRCLHQRDFLGETYVAYRRRSKFFSLSYHDNTKEDVFFQLLNFM